MRIAVFTGSRLGPESHRRAAASFATDLARAGVGIVYGGGDVGLMGLVADGSCHWVSNEGSRVLPRVSAAEPPQAARAEYFVLGVDGRGLAWTHGHGRSMTWLA